MHRSVGPTFRVPPDRSPALSALRHAGARFPRAGSSIVALPLPNQHAIAYSTFEPTPLNSNSLNPFGKQIVNAPEPRRILRSGSPVQPSLPHGRGTAGRFPDM